MIILDYELAGYTVSRNMVLFWTLMCLATKLYDMGHKHRHPLTIIGEHKTSLDGQNVSYTLKQSYRARCARLEIRQATGLTIVIPKSYDVTDVHTLMQKKKRWILNNLAKCHRIVQPEAVKCLKSGDHIPYLGQELMLVTQRDHGSDASVVLDKNRLIISVGNKNNGVGLILEQWYRTQADQLLKEKTDRQCAKFGLTYNRLTIRGQRSRWASCSHKRNLSFNWKLMMVPEPVIDYVIIHELMHLKQMNHTKRFWKLVDERCPDWREHRTWLKQHEVELATRLST
jgi:predicted metal-dependent hydrolase